MHNRRGLRALPIAVRIGFGIGLVVVLVVTGLWALNRTDQPSGPLTEARQLLSGASSRDAVREANDVALAATFIAQELDGCRRETPGSRCTGLAAALGYAQVTAARMIRCDNDGRVASRRALLRYLDAVALIAADAPAKRITSPPSLPSCAA